jgi:serine/threonine protein kinase
MSIKKAELLDGQVVDYLPDSIGEGAEKIVYFTPDKRQVVALYRDPADANDPERKERLRSILNRFNPTLDPVLGEYWKNLFCWPTGIVIRPTLGVVAPAYPESFFFKHNHVEKTGKWFTSEKLKKMLPPEERGDFLNYIKLCILMSRAVRRLHSSGLAHSDLSYKNILVDPQSGSIIIIDIDSLVVPNVHPPKVMGSAGCMAPEVLAGEKVPNIYTDLHAMAVLIYQYLLTRHPLIGPKINSTKSTEDDDLLSMGANALFIEHPSDSSNRPHGLTKPFTILGPYLSDAIRRCFIDGLHAPTLRPSAADWERALIKTTDLIYPCCAVHCEAKWFVLHDSTAGSCPFCNWQVSGPVPVMQLYIPRKAGQFVSDRWNLMIWNEKPLYLWHMFANIWPGEEVDKTSQGYFQHWRQKWYLVNNSKERWTINSVEHIYPGNSLEIVDNMQILFSEHPSGKLATIQFWRI